jgi:hypothetical protein
MALQVFHLFPKLPAELRLKVWYHTLPGPRELKPKWTSQRNPHSMRLYQQFQQLSGSPVSQERTGGPQVADPIALRINRESRDLALTYYERRSGTLEPGEGYYIDFKIDSLHFNISFHPRQIFPRIVNRTYYDNGVLRSFDTTWIRYEWNNGACGPGIDPTDEMKRTRAVTICSDCFKNWTGWIPSVELWMRDWHEFFPNLEVIYLKFPSLRWSKPIIEPGRLRFDNLTRNFGNLVVASVERYIEGLAREKEIKKLEWKPLRVEAVWLEGVDCGPKYIYPSKYSRMNNTGPLHLMPLF